MFKPQPHPIPNAVVSSPPQPKPPGCPILRAFASSEGWDVQSPTTAFLPQSQIWVPHLRDGLIVAKVGIGQSPTAFLPQPTTAGLNHNLIQDLFTNRKQPGCPILRASVSSEGWDVQSPSNHFPIQHGPSHNPNPINPLQPSPQNTPAKHPVKPQNHLTPSKPTTSKWHFSYGQPTKIEVEDKNSAQRGKEQALSKFNGHAE